MPRLCAVVVVLFVTSVTAVATHDAPPPLVAAAARAAEVALPAPVTPAATTPTTQALLGIPLPVPLPPLPVPIPGLTPAPTPPTTAAPAAPAAPATTTTQEGGLRPYAGLGTWVDVYDWSATYTNNQPGVYPHDVDRMADAGVQTLYLQASKHDSPTDVLEPNLLQPLIDRAKARGLKVVVWYLPTLVDPGADLRRLVAVANLPGVDGLAVDIEARNVADVVERNRRLIELSSALRAALPGRTIGGIVLPAVVLEVINARFWPAFPYREIAPFYDVWLPMAYWTNRTQASGYRDAYRYTKENVDRLRNNLGQPNALVHPIGGIGHRTTAADLEKYTGAALNVKAMGASIYDWRTTAPGLWERLRRLRL